MIIKSVAKKVISVIIFEFYLTFNHVMWLLSLICQ